jgi:hypothetical protein
MDLDEQMYAQDLARGMMQDEGEEEGEGAEAAAGASGDPGAPAPSPDEESAKKASAGGTSSHLEDAREQSSLAQLWGLYKLMGVPGAALSMLGIVGGVVVVYIWQLVSGAA